jgi:nucleoside-triphosphatase
VKIFSISLLFGYDNIMAICKKNILLTGAPSSGKTTVIKKIVQKLDYPTIGFYTEEEWLDGRRVGFVMKTLDGKRAYLAHQDIKSDFHIRRYGVSIENIEAVAAPSIYPQDQNCIIILDEIGKMECFSEAFKQTVIRVLEAPNIIIGTITLGGDDFIIAIKKRDDVEILEVHADNRDTMPGVILKKITDLLNASKRRMVP